MKTLSNPRSFAFGLLGILSLISFAAGFGAAFRSDAARTQELGQLAWNHLLYAVEVKDDMAVIDWSKTLGKSENLLAFRAAQNSKTLAEGGNQDFLNKVDLTLAFALPDRFYVAFSSNKPSSNTLTLLMAYRANPGPFFWGLTAAGISFVSCILMALVLSRPIRPQADQLEAVPGRQVPFSPPKSSRSAHTHSSASDQAFLFLDKGFVIRQVNRQAAGFFGKESNDLLNAHLFDLVPEPELMRAIEDGLEIKNLKPFRKIPHLMVTLKPEAEGTLLILEPGEGPTDPKKH